jgi:hypothetical protein
MSLGYSIFEKFCNALSSPQLIEQLGMALRKAKQAQNFQKSRSGNQRLLFFSY